MNTTESTGDFVCVYCARTMELNITTGTLPLHKAIGQDRWCQGSDSVPGVWVSKPSGSSQGYHWHGLKRCTPPCPRNRPDPSEPYEPDDLVKFATWCSSQNIYPARLIDSKMDEEYNWLALIDRFRGL